MPAPQDPKPKPAPAPAPKLPEKWTTLIADYSDNRVIEVDEDGQIAHSLDEVFGAWDAELLDNGHLLITEFSVSRVREVDWTGKVLYNYGNPSGL